jgi:hypothetical protein
MQSKSKKKSEIYTNSGQVLSIETSFIVEMNERLMLKPSSSEMIELDVKIVADFKTIPKEYHSTFIHIMSARYGGVVKAYDNVSPFDTPKKEAPKWWQFWKKIELL